MTDFNSETMRKHWLQRVTSTSIFFLLMYLLPAVSQNAEYKWGNLRIGGGGYVTGIVIHPSDKNIMYIRTDVGGAYRWNSENKEWQQMLNWVGPDNANMIGVDGIAIDPTNPERVYLALGQRINEEGGIFRSEDRGKTWTKLFDINFEGNGREARWIGECIAVDPHNSKIIFAGTRRNGLWHTTDDGKTWNKVTGVPDGYTGNQPTGVRTIVFDPATKKKGRSSKIYVGVPGSGIYFSNDGGLTFSELEGSPGNPSRMQVVNKELFVTHSKGIVFYSNGIWSDITPTAGKNFVGLAIDETDSRKIVVAERYRSYSNPIYKSSDKGKTWEQINTKANPSKLNVDVNWWSKTRFSSATAGMAFVPGGSGELFYTDWFGVWQTPNVWAKKSEWNTIVNGHEETVVLTLVAPPAGAMVYSGVADVFGFKHDKTDVYPAKSLYPSSECFSIAVCEQQPSNIAILGAKSWEGDKTFLATSSDMGQTWTNRKLPEGSILGMISISSTNPDRMVYISGNGTAYYTHNRGDNWDMCHNVPQNIVSINRIWSKDEILASDLVDGSFYIFKDGVMYTSHDGVSWTEKNKMQVSNFSGYYKHIVPVPGRKGELWICLEKEGLWKTTDNGKTYSRVQGMDVAKLASFGVPAPGSNNPTIYCYGITKGKWGIFQSSDMGISWNQLNDEQHAFPAGVKAIAADRKIFGRIYLGSGGCGLYYGEPVNGNTLTRNN